MKNSSQGSFLTEKVVSKGKILVFLPAIYKRINTCLGPTPLLAPQWIETAKATPGK